LQKTVRYSRVATNLFVSLRTVPAASFLGWQPGGCDQAVTFNFLHAAYHGRKTMTRKSEDDREESRMNKDQMKRVKKESREEGRQRRNKEERQCR